MAAMIPPRRFFAKLARDERCGPEDQFRQMSDSEQRVLEYRLRQQKKESEEDSKWLQEEESNFRKRLSCSDRSDRSDTDSLEGVSSSPVHSSSGISNHGSPVSREPVSDESESIYKETANKKMESIPTADIDRTNDGIYDYTTNVVRAVMALSTGVQMSKASEYLDLVKRVGIELRSLLASVDDLVMTLPSSTHRQVAMAQKVLSKDMADLVNAMKLAQDNSMTTMEGEYRKGMLSAAHILAMDAKNLLDVVDSVRQSLKLDSSRQNNNGQPEISADSKIEEET